MTIFKVGEVVEGCRMLTTERNGMECEVLSPLHAFSARCMVTGEVVNDIGYAVQWVDGVKSKQPAHKLRKNRPPKSDNSTARQVMLDCIERARMGQGVEA